mmetsp:Transcript_17107/g.52533  ORF Transcript_17107/g.52533 Transcript_17107/m.52533 type:complete len:736 (-) Transcript_17107:2200-4407(-)
MGLLKVGQPVSWEDGKQHMRYIRRHGLLQFLETYRAVRHIENDELKWGDEVETAILKLDAARRGVRAHLRGMDIMQELNRLEAEHVHLNDGVVWHQEYGAWMIESTPRAPYGGSVTDLFAVERNMRLRRRRLLAALAPDEIAPYMVNFPLLGVGEFCEPWAPPRGPVANAEAIPDSVINPHPRFGTLTRNIRTRRGANVDIQLPLFRDERTPEFAEGAPPDAAEPTVKMDAMAYGMGCCCLQVTFQARDLAESRYMYDQLAVMAPIMLALTAGAPIFKGRLVDTDVRWDVISMSCDDRTPAERGEAPAAADGGAGDPEMAGGGVRRVYKSRYDSISRYIYTCNPDSARPCCPKVAGMIKARHVVERFNDVPCAIDEEAKALLMENGLDEVLAGHLAHLFARDPLVIFDGNVSEVDDHASTEHFESIQSTNWQTVRWKPPPLVADGEARSIGWRVEFRSMEIQPTDFENAAFSVFIVLLTRAILAFDLALYTPLSQVDENMRRAHFRDAARTQKFFFRKWLAPVVEHSPEAEEGDGVKAAADEKEGEGGGKSVMMGACSFHAHDETDEMTLDEIFNGTDTGDFPGLVPLVEAYLESVGLPDDDLTKLDRYLQFISDRAAGRVLTVAQWMREFVTDHAAYQQDSVVPEEIVFDLTRAMSDIGIGARQEPKLLGNVVVHPVMSEEPYETILPARRLSDSKRNALLYRYTQRVPFRTQEQRVSEAIQSLATQPLAAGAS